MIFSIGKKEELYENIDHKIDVIIKRMHEWEIWEQECHKCQKQLLETEE